MTQAHDSKGSGGSTYDYKQQCAIAANHIKRKRWQLAEEIYRHVANEYALCEPARAGLVEALLGQDRLDEARFEANRICGHREMFATGKMLLAQIATRQNAHSEARRHLEDAARYDPDRIDVIEELARFLFRFGSSDEAKVVLEELTGRDPSNNSARCNLGTLQTRNGQLEDAIQSYQQALKLNPANTIARHNLEYLQAQAAKSEVVSEQARKNDDEPHTDGITKGAVAR